MDRTDVQIPQHSLISGRNGYGTRTLSATSAVTKHQKTVLSVTVEGVEGEGPVFAPSKRTWPAQLERAHHAWQAHASVASVAD